MPFSSLKLVIPSFHFLGKVKLQKTNEMVKLVGESGASETG